MALFPYNSSIEIPVNDRVIGDTIIKQKARFCRLDHVQHGDFSHVAITVSVHLYASVDGDYGPELVSPGFAHYPMVLGGDNNTIVDQATGEILAVRGSESDAEWTAKAEAYPQTVMFQADFFLLLRDTQPVQIGELIQHHINQANQLGRFN